MKHALARLVDGRDLSAEEMRSVVSQIMDGRASDAQIGAFLAAIHAKGETVDELVGAVEVLRERAVRVRVGGPLVDTCGTGGDGLGYFNISTAAAFVAAAGGARVAKHGNRAASGSVGAADVLEALGVDIELGPDAAAAAIESIGIAFLFAPRYHPAVRHVASARRELGFRTLFNLTGPLCNPAGATRQVIGLYSADWLDSVAQALMRLGCEHALVVHGEDGSDEITPAAATDIVEVRGGRLSRTTVQPEQFGIARCVPSELVGGDVAANAAAVRAVLTGQPGPRADAVALNAGAALYVAGRANDLEQGVARARAVLAEGGGSRVLDASIAFSAEPLP